jgi:hypothetical protein
MTSTETPARMDLDAIARKIPSIVYKPGYSFRHHSTSKLLSEVYVEINYHARNSDRRFARAGYPETAEVHFYALIKVPYEGMTNEEFDEVIMREIVRLELHEAREFYRRRDQDYAAPFHPHRWDTEPAWHRFMERHTLATFEMRGTRG